jgi:hypothetical protein
MISAEKEAGLLTRLLLAFVLLAVLALPVRPCEVIVFPPAGFPAGLVLFVGKVTAYQNAETTIAGVTKPFGLRVRVIDALVGVARDSEVAVYRLPDGPDCKPYEPEADEIQREYPVDSLVSVVGSPVDSAAATLGRAQAVFAESNDFGQIARVPSLSFDGTRDPFDFRAFEREYEQLPANGMLWRNAQRDWYADYRFLKTLFLIEHGKGDPLPLVASLVYYPGWHRTPAIDIYRRILESAKVPPHQRRTLLAELSSHVGS